MYVLYRNSDNNSNNNNLHPKLCVSIRKQYKRFISFDRIRIGIIFVISMACASARVCVCVDTHAWNIFNTLTRNWTILYSFIFKNDCDCFENSLWAKLGIGGTEGWGLGVGV